MYCKSCGKWIDADSAFCRYCGAVQDAGTPAPQPQMPEAPAPSPYYAELAKTMAANPQSEESRVYSVPAPFAETSARSGMSTSRKVFFIVLGLIVAVAIVAGMARTGLPGASGSSGSSSLGGLVATSYTPPSYVKQVTAYAEGSKAFAIYFVLADSSGLPTAASGFATLTISQEHTDYSTDRKTETVLYTIGFPVTQSDFHTTTVGQGAFAHDLLLCSVGRVPYSNFTAQPTEFSGKVSIKFSPTGGATMEGHDTVIFDK